MFARFKNAVVVLWRPWWVRIVVPLLAALGAYDLFLSQFIPEQWAERVPRLYDIAVMSGGLLPWWGWLLLFQAVILASAIDYMVRKIAELEARPLYVPEVVGGEISALRAEFEKRAVLQEAYEEAKRLLMKINAGFQLAAGPVGMEDADAFFRKGGPPHPLLREGFMEAMRNAFTRAGIIWGSSYQNVEDRNRRMDLINEAYANFVRLKVMELGEQLAVSTARYNLGKER
jgi:hypothetical protein